MDREVLVEEVQKLARELRKREGPLALLMLVSPDPAVADDWNVIVSALGLDRKTRAQGIRDLTDVLRRTMSKDVWPTIKRATVLRTDDPFVNAMTSAFETRASILDLQSCNIAGFEIPKAIVFASRKRVVVRPRRPQTSRTPTNGPSSPSEHLIRTRTGDRR